VGPGGNPKGNRRRCRGGDHWEKWLLPAEIYLGGKRSERKEKRPDGQQIYWEVGAWQQGNLGYQIPVWEGDAKCSMGARDQG